MIPYKKRVSAFSYGYPRLCLIMQKQNEQREICQHFCLIPMPFAQNCVTSMSGTDFSLLMKGFCMVNIIQPFIFGRGRRKSDKYKWSLYRELLLSKLQTVLDEYMNEIEKQYCYIEVQLWCDDLINRSV